MDDFLTQSFGAIRPVTSRSNPHVRRLDELLRRKLTTALALRALAGTSSKLYTSMYSEGLIRSFWNEADWGPCAAYAVLGGESPEPEQVLARLSEAVAKVAAEGFEPDAFERCRRAEYGMRIRALGQSAGLADSLARSAFAGTDFMRSFELLPQLTSGECAAFAAEYLAPERLALAVVQPKPRKDM